MHRLESAFAFGPRVAVGALAALTLCAARAKGEEQGGALKTPFCAASTHPEERERAEVRALARALEERRFADLAKALEELRTAGRAPGTPLQRLDQVVEQLAAGESVGPHLDAWCAATPPSALALASRGTHLVRAAWRARGGGYADTVSEEGWKQFGELLRKAKSDLERALALDPKWALPAAQLITVAKGLSLPRAAAEGYLRQALAADPSHYSAHTRMLDYLKRKWHGSDEEMFRFAREAAAKSPKAPELKYLIVEAHREMQFRQDLRAYLGRPEVQREVDAAFGAVLEAYPRWTSAVRVRAEDAAMMRDWPLLVRWLRQGAELGDGYCQMWMARSGYLRHPSLPDMPRIPEAEALRWLCRSAFSGDSWSCYQMGRFYSQGLHTPVDQAQASRWYMWAAAGGNHVAMLVVGRRYRQGVGGPVDLERAGRSFLRAAKAGNADALAELGLLWWPSNRQRARELFSAAAQRGSALGHYGMGRTYEVERNPLEAARSYRQAIQGGNAEAKGALQKLLSKHPDLRSPGDPE